jgi:hypothetical protein
MLTDPKALFALFGQHSVEAFRYLQPLGRYVFVGAIIMFFVDVAQSRGWIKTVRPTLWIKTHDLRLLSVAAFVSVVVLCLLLLLISWTNGGTQDYSAIGGLLPYSDAAGYFDGAERLLHDGVLTSWAERRPLNSAFFAARLFVSGENFYYAMAIQALVAATALFLASNAIAKVQGAAVALVFFAINFSFLSSCLYRSLSEPLGISLGLISFALYCPSIAHRNMTHYALATFFLTLALLTRAGAMFELPASIFFAMLFFADNWRRRCAALAATCAAIAGGWLLNAVLVRTYGTGGGLLSNFSYVIYGLSQGGKTWSQAMIDFPQLSGNESQIATFLYHRAFESVVSNPLLLVTGVAKSLLRSLAYLPSHIFHLLGDMSDDGLPPKPIQTLVLAALLIPATLYGTFRAISERRTTLTQFHLFLLFHVAGFIVSLPFFYQDGGIRLTAATFPFLAAAVAIALAACKKEPMLPEPAQVSRTLNYIAISVGATIVAASLATPLVSRLASYVPVLDVVRCDENSIQLQLAFGDGTAHINILDGNVSSVLPDIRRSDFRVSDINEIKDFWQAIPLPATLIASFDYVTRSVRLVSGPAGFASGPRRVRTICATSLGNGIFSSRGPD